jgi:enoyl-CoA hydratase/carnithine racemase
MLSTDEIQFEEIIGEEGNLGLITLTRQKALNALSLNMIRAMDKQLAIWADSSSIIAVIIRAASGRAFCAGGDIRAMYERKMANDQAFSGFFHEEYQLNRRIFHFPKPYIALLDGITMGGGAGISLHGSHRIATENLLFAMPETGIGFHPDVGTSFFLSRLPHHIGIYLGLTGARISCSDCLALKLVDHVIAPESQEQLIQVMAESFLPNKMAVTEVIKQFEIDVPKSELFNNKIEIKNHFSKNSVEAILQSLLSTTSKWAHKTAEIIKKNSPTSLKVTLQELIQAANLDFDACMQTEYRLTMRFVDGHDFFEGVRAAVIDKDQKPNWKPVTLEEVTTDNVAYYFEPLVEELV